MERKIRIEQKKLLNILADKMDDFYLAGGTALELFYYDHRLSDDLDFFIQQFDITNVRWIVGYLQKQLKKEIVLVGDNLSKKTVEMVVYNIEYDKDKFLKMDFVRDPLPLLKPLNLFEGIKVLSVEDIYLRKIYAISGLPINTSSIGRIEFVGARQEAKDLFDIYFLSCEFMGLADFLDKYCNNDKYSFLKEGVTVWFRKFNRVEMKLSLLDIKTHKNIQFVDIERHFKREVGKILEREVDF